MPQSWSFQAPKQYENKFLLFTNYLDLGINILLEEHKFTKKEIVIRSGILLQHISKNLKQFWNWVMVRDLNISFEVNAGKKACITMNRVLRSILLRTQKRRAIESLFEII